MWSGTARHEPEHDPVVAEYIIGLPEIPQTIGDFELRLGQSLCTDYEDGSGQSVSARWSAVVIKRSWCVWTVTVNLTGICGGKVASEVL